MHVVSPAFAEGPQNDDPLQCYAKEFDRMEEGKPRILESEEIKTQGKAGLTFWGRWKCSKCGAKDISAEPNEFGVRSCPSCGKTHSGEKFYTLKNKKGEEILTDDDHLDGDDKHLVKKGKMWACKVCGYQNVKDHIHCASCTNSRLQDNSGMAGALIAKAQAAGIQNPKKALIVGGTVVLLGAAAWVIKWGFQTHDYPGEVTETYWQNSETVEAFSLTTERAWRDEITEHSAVMPVNGSGETAGAFNIRNCVDEKYGEREYACGTETYTYTEDVYEDVPNTGTETVDNGDGSFSVVPATGTHREKTGEIEKVGTRTKMCTEDLKKPKCDYDTYEWKYKNSDSRSGRNPTSDEVSRVKGTWPNLSVGRHDRRSRSSTYKVSFQYQQNKKTIPGDLEMDSVEDLVDHAKGTKLVIKKNNFGKVLGIKKAIEPVK